MKKAIIALLMLGVVVVGGAALYARLLGGDGDVKYRTAEVKRGELLISIGATGTVQAEESVDVGAQVAGKINVLGAEPRGETDEKFKGKTVDYGTVVTEGLVLARIDDSIYKAVRDQAKAAVDRAKADLLQMQSKLDQAAHDWKRAQSLHDMSPRGKDMPASLSASSQTPLVASIKGISDADYDLAKANYEVAQATVEIGKASIEQAQATLQMAETNLGYTVIKSPVDGTIIDRRVNIGQTVVASLNAPSLFLIAKDLRRMQVWASVNEADIGRIKLDMPVRFTVDAFPEDTFEGRVAQIRLNASMTQNVVTYTVVVSADNPDMKLLPYLTADVDFQIDKRQDVLLVPNPALSWQPQPSQIAPVHRETSGGSPGSSERGDRAERGERGTRGGAAAAKAEPPKHQKKDHGNVWVREGEYLRPVEVKIGQSDGMLTEVTSDELKDGQEIVIGVERAARAAEATNPFGPPAFRRRGGG